MGWGRAPHLTQPLPDGGSELRGGEWPPGRLPGQQRAPRWEVGRLRPRGRLARRESQGAQPPAPPGLGQRPPPGTRPGGGGRGASFPTRTAWRSWYPAALWPPGWALGKVSPSRKGLRRGWGRNPAGPGPGHTGQLSPAGQSQLPPPPAPGSPGLVTAPPASGSAWRPEVTDNFAGLAGGGRGRCARLCGTGGASLSWGAGGSQEESSQQKWGAESRGHL